MGRALALLAGLWLLGCAGDVVLRASPERTPGADTTLTAVSGLSVAVPPAGGEAAAKAPVGERHRGMGRSAAPIYLTEEPGVVLRRVVTGELSAAGVQVVESGGDVAVGIRVLDFEVESRPGSLGWWDLSASARMALRVEKEVGSEDFTEFVYSAERKGRTWGWPGIGSTERIAAECLDDLARLVSQRAALAEALGRYATAP